MTDNRQTKPITEQSEAYLKAFDFFNEELFQGALSRPMLCLTRNSNIIGGYFSPDKWRNETGKTIHEIGLNANLMEENNIIKLMNILIHEMIHLWQHENNCSGRGGYHNQAFADKAKELELSFQSPDGKETGDAVATHLKEGGKAELAVANMPEDAVFPWMANVIPPDGQPQPQPGQQKTPEKKRPPGSRAKYTCPQCGLNVWAKSGVRILCIECDKTIIEAKV